MICEICGDIGGTKTGVDHDASDCPDRDIDDFDDTESEYDQEYLDD